MIRNSVLTFLPRLEIIFASFQIKEHNESCYEAKNLLVKPLARGFLPTMGPAGLHFLSHFLEDRGLKQQYQDRVEDEKEVGTTTPMDGLKSDTESKSNSMNVDDLQVINFCPQNIINFKSV
jgi:hypothetical protein